MVEGKTISYSAGILFTIASLITAGAIVLTPEQIDNSVTCSSNGITILIDTFVRFSDTNITGYELIDAIEIPRVCTNGEWIPTRKYMELNNITEDQLAFIPLENSTMTEDNATIITEETKKIDKSGKYYVKGTTLLVDIPALVCTSTTGNFDVNDCIDAALDKNME